MGKSYENLGGHLTELKLDHKNGKEKSDQLTEFLGRIFYIESYGCSGHRFSICIFNTAPGTIFTSQVTPRGYVGSYFFGWLDHVYFMALSWWMVSKIVIYNILVTTMMMMTLQVGFVSLLPTIVRCHPKIRAKVWTNLFFFLRHGCFPTRLPIYTNNHADIYCFGLPGQATIPQTPQRAADASGTKHGCMGYIDETEWSYIQSLHGLYIYIYI